MSEFTTAGGVVNDNLITGLTAPGYLAVSGGNLFIANDFGVNTISEYTIGGTLVDTSLITGLNVPIGVAVSGGDIFVANSGNGTIGEYTTSGGTVNASLISGLSDPSGIAVGNGDVFVTTGSGVGEWTTSGGVVNASLLPSVFGSGITVSGSDLFVSSSSGGTIGEYTTSGGTVNAALVSGLTNPYDIATAPDGSVFYTHIDTGFHSDGHIGQYPGSQNLVADGNKPYGIAVVLATPEPSSWALLAIGA